MKQEEGSSIETGTVLKAEGSWATVITNKSKSCRECGKAQAGICGKGGAGLVMKVRNPLAAKPGDTVTLGLEKTTHIKIYVLAYVLPVLVLFASAFAGHELSQSLNIKGLDVITGFAGLIAAVIFSFRKIYKLDKTSHLRITGILHNADDCRNFIGQSPEEMDYLSAFNGK